MIPYAAGILTKLKLGEMVWLGWNTVGNFIASKEGQGYSAGSSMLCGIQLSDMLFLTVSYHPEQTGFFAGSESAGNRHRYHRGGVTFGFSPNRYFTARVSSGVRVEEFSGTSEIPIGVQVGFSW